MSQFNHLNDIPDKIMNCSKCGKKFSISISDGSMWEAMIQNLFNVLGVALIMVKNTVGI